MSEHLQTSGLMTALQPIRHLLDSGEDVAVNEPLRAWHYCSGKWNEHIIPELTERRCHGIATLAEAQERPKERKHIISVDLPSGHRAEFLLPPATATGRVVMCFRRMQSTLSSIDSITTRFGTARWNKWTEREALGRPGMDELLALWDQGDIIAFLRKFAAMRLKPVFCGETGAGKTDVLKTYCSLLPRDWRLVVIEDALEGVFLQENAARLLAKKGGSIPTDLLSATMRLRPTIVPVSELREAEMAYVFVDQTSTGHPGSPTTAHGGTAKQGAHRIANLVKSSSTGKQMLDQTVAEKVAGAVDLIMPIENLAGTRDIAEAWFAPDAARRGETFLDLLAA